MSEHTPQSEEDERGPMTSDQFERLAKWAETGVFPLKSESPNGIFEYRGLSKRELFAAMAMQGLAATWDSHNYGLATRSVEVADALLKALAPPAPRPPACGKEFAPGQICVSDAGHEGECDDVPY